MRNRYIQIYFWGTSSPENSYPGYEFSGELVPFRLGYEFSRVRVLQGTSSPDTMCVAKDYLLYKKKEKKNKNSTSPNSKQFTDNKSLDTKFDIFYSKEREHCGNKDKFW